ncbi:hypothetical protein CVT26_010166 [Gymnopilus dilepis]|uniref:Uncharacterized protein n=1 Tax=Gymnopilus dilepis TaxID=231916 RepID=A0A409YRX3_9AGAR|nr:hypothetical protein CVT26_010166 [Gymnopilus dilepis]
MIRADCHAATSVLVFWRPVGLLVVVIDVRDEPEHEQYQQHLDIDHHQQHHFKHLEQQQLFVLGLFEQLVVVRVVEYAYELVDDEFDDTAVTYADADEGDDYFVSDTLGAAPVQTSLPSGGHPKSFLFTGAPALVCIYAPHTLAGIFSSDFRLDFVIYVSPERALPAPSHGWLSAGLPTKDHSWILAFCFKEPPCLPPPVTTRTPTVGSSSRRSHHLATFLLFEFRLRSSRFTTSPPNVPRTSVRAYMRGFRALSFELHLQRGESPG